MLITRIAELLCTARHQLEVLLINCSTRIAKLLPAQIRRKLEVLLIDHGWPTKKKKAQ